MPPLPNPPRVASNEPILLFGFDWETQKKLDFSADRWVTTFLRRTYTDENDPDYRRAPPAKQLEIKYGNNIAVLFLALVQFARHRQQNCFWAAIARGFSFNQQYLQEYVSVLVAARRAGRRFGGKHRCELLDAADTWIDIIDGFGKTEPPVPRDAFVAAILISNAQKFYKSKTEKPLINAARVPYHTTWSAGSLMKQREANHHDDAGHGGSSRFEDDRRHGREGFRGSFSGASAHSADDSFQPFRKRQLRSLSPFYHADEPDAKRRLSESQPYRLADRVQQAPTGPAYDRSEGPRLADRVQPTPTDRVQPGTDSAHSMIKKEVSSASVSPDGAPFGDIGNNGHRSDTPMKESKASHSHATQPVHNDDVMTLLNSIGNPRPPTKTSAPVPEHSESSDLPKDTNSSQAQPAVMADGHLTSDDVNLIKDDVNALLETVVALADSHSMLVDDLHRVDAGVSTLVNRSADTGGMPVSGTNPEGEGPSNQKTFYEGLLQQQNDHFASLLNEQTKQFEAMNAKLVEHQNERLRALAETWGKGGQVPAISSQSISQSLTSDGIESSVERAIKQPLAELKDQMVAHVNTALEKPEPRTWGLELVALEEDLKRHLYRIDKFKQKLSGQRLPHGTSEYMADLMVLLQKGIKQAQTGQLV